MAQEHTGTKQEQPGTKPEQTGTKPEQTPSTAALQTAQRQGMTGIPSAFSLVRRLMDDMDRVFEDFGFAARGTPLGQIFEQGLDRLGGTWNPQIDVREEGNELVVRADVPGVDKNDLKVELLEDTLVLEGERRDQKREERPGFFRSERFYGSFRRVIPLPPGCDASNANATFRNGVLEIHLTKPKEQQSRARRVEIRDESGTPTTRH